MNALPPYARALFGVLAGRTAPPGLERQDWQEILRFADRTQCTLFLRGAEGLPDWFREEVEARFRRNASRRARLRAEYEEVAGALSRQGIEFVLLKGFTHEAGFAIEGGQRVQYDLDLWCSPGDVPRAENALQEEGYFPHGGSALSQLHGRPLVRPSSWRWREDYFDPDMPVPVEVHGRLWDGRPDLPGTALFWDRRMTLEIGGLRIPALAEADRAAFAALHCLRHLLYQNARPSHVLELARFLNARSEDDALWNSWRATQDEPLRQAQAVAFRFAVEWFGACVPPAVDREWSMVSPGVRNWFADEAFSPVENLIRPNKNVVWLHRALLPRRLDRVALLVSRLLPARLPERSEAWNRSYGAHLFRRAQYHGLALARTVWSGWRWRKTAASAASETSDWNRPKV